MTGTRRPPTVHKFGGASLADAAAMHHAVAVIQDLPPGPVVIVASAMAGVTDRLLGLALLAADGKPADSGMLSSLRRLHVDAARQIIRTAGTRRVVLAAIETSLNELRALLDGLRVVRELTPRTSDYIAARGERLSAMLLAAALADTRRRVRLLDAVELIVTDGHFGAAAPDFAATDRRVRRLVGPLLQRGVIPVVPGFIGAGPAATLVTLGRGGSDLTATLLARALHATAVSLWKDVPGFLTGDPRVVADARVIPQLHAREAAELAYYGAKVLHPRALIPLEPPDDPGVRPAVREPDRRARDRPSSSPDTVACARGIGHRCAGARHRHRERDARRAWRCGATFETLPQAGFPVSLVSQGRPNIRSCSACRRQKRARSKRRSERNSARRSRGRTSTASRCGAAWRRWPWWAGHGWRARRRGAGCSVRWHMPASTSSPSRRVPRSSTSRS